MTLNLKHDYIKHLRNANPIPLGQNIIHPPKGSLGSITVIPRQTIPPINTNINFDMIPKFQLSQHPGLAAIDDTILPENFNPNFEKKGH